MRWLMTAVLLLVLSIAHVIALEKAAEESNAYSREDMHAFVMPSKILKILTLDYDGLVSDYMFLKGIILLGSVSERKGSTQIQESEWRWVYHILDAATDLDPFFYDPYYFANGYFPSYGNMTKEANTLLEKGSRYRNWDWKLPFFIGFNHFYYLHEDNEAAPYFMEAARRPGGSLSFASIAAKLAYRGRRTENSIYFLEEMVKITDDESMKKLYQLRIQSYRSVLFLERAVDEYKAKFHKSPKDLDTLIRKGFIKELPLDPFGGKFYIDAQGMIKTTSEVIMLHDRK